MYMGDDKGDLWPHAGPHRMGISWTIPEFFLVELFELEIKVNVLVDCAS